MQWLKSLVLVLFALVAQAQEPDLTGKFVRYKGWEKLQATEGTRYVLVTAEWCAPCKVLKADIEKQVFPYGLNVILVDYDEHTDDAVRMLGGSNNATLPRLIRYHTDETGKVDGAYWNSNNKTLAEFFELQKLHKQ